MPTPTPQTVNISYALTLRLNAVTDDLIKDKFSCEFLCDIKAKNKCKLKMYIVE